MLNDIRDKIEGIKNQNPNWEETVEQYFSDPAKQNPAPKAIEDFYHSLDWVYAEAKDNDVLLNQALVFFPENMRALAEKMLNNRLNRYRAFKPIRNIQEEHKSSFEPFIDSIWAQYVIRFNPAFSVSEEFRNKFNLSEEDAEAFMRSLDNLAMYCVSNLLNYDAILDTVAERTGLDKDSVYVNYIARKIDKDYTDLRLNYIVSQLSSMSP